MNPCICPSPAGMPFLDYMRARGRCPVHGFRAQGPPFDFRQYDRYDQRPDPEPWPDLESRPDEGVFEGMSRFGLCQLAEMAVGDRMTIQGYDVWRWEESGPVTRLIADAHPEGRVVIQDHELMHADAPLFQSLLDDLLKFWGEAREWNTERDIFHRTTVVRWRRPQPRRVTPPPYLYAPGAVVIPAGSAVIQFPIA